MTEIRYDNNNYAVQLRREDLAKGYLAGVPTHILWMDYEKKYKMSRASFEKDITLIRDGLEISIRDNFDQILNTELLFLYSTRDKALQDDDKPLALRVQKQITDLIKIVAPKQSNDVRHGVNIQVNNHTNNMNLPDLSIDQIRELLNTEQGSKSVVDITGFQTE